MTLEPGSIIERRVGEMKGVRYRIDALETVLPTGYGVTAHRVNKATGSTFGTCRHLFLSIRDGFPIGWKPL